MSYLEELLPEFRKGAKIRCKYWAPDMFIQNIDDDDIDIEDLSRDDWEFYQDPIDWQYIIDHKCLCWFWDNKGDEKQIGYLVGINDKRFYLEAPEDCFNSYTYCRPVRKNEVTFYEDKKDEL